MVEVTREQASYTLLRGDSLKITHHNETVTLSAVSPLIRQIPPTPEHEVPTQPTGREPNRRSSER
jgi:alpha,alpha-trehalose phosphorylase